jgi:putative flippase GtrA
MSAINKATFVPAQLLKNSRVFFLKLAGYFLVGGGAALLDSSCFYCAKYLWHFNYVNALIIGFIPGMTTNFILCNACLFYKVNRSLLAAWVTHCLASMGSFLVNLLIMTLLIVGLKFQYYLAARLIAIVVGFFLSFLLIRYWAFRDNLYYK